MTGDFNELNRRLFQQTACPDLGEAIFIARITSMIDCFVVPPRNDDLFWNGLSMVEVSIFQIHRRVDDIYTRGVISTAVEKSFKLDQ